MQELNPHPRLYISRDNLNRLHDIPDTPQFQAAWREVQELAAQGLAATPLAYNEAGHNSLLIRTRLMQTRVVTLAALWWKTREEQYRSAVLDCVREIGDWEYWSWLAMRKGETDPNAVFDLSYGENSATLAIAYDWLFDVLTNEERTLFVEIAKRRAFQPFLHRTEPGQWNNFFGRPSSNWNSVCTGGTGLLALAMLDELPDASEVLARVESSIAPFMQHLEETGGGWPEGLGYWNYGMRYAFMYLRSWENAHGKEHPLLQLPAARRTLHFPLDFTPNGLPCSFGDAGGWAPLPFHYAMAERFDDRELLARLDEAWNRDLAAPNTRRGSPWPDHLELLVLHPRHNVVQLPERRQVVQLYEGLDWGFLADRLPQPQFYVAVRGGNTKVPHSHRDLLSFHCVAGDEKMIENIGATEYMDTTFSSRRDEIFEMTPASKNTLLINGVGITSGSAVQTSRELFGELPGIRMDATEAMGEVNDGPAALFCGRVFVLFDEYSLLIVDRVEVRHSARVEARFYTRRQVEMEESAARIHGERRHLQMEFAATKPTLLQSAQPPMTSPLAPPYTMLRWSTRDVTPQGIIFATLLTPDQKAQPAEVSIIEDTGEYSGSFAVNARVAGATRDIRFTATLLPA